MCHSENMSKIFFKIKNKKIQNDIIIVTLNSFQGLVVRMCKIIICYYFFVPIILSFLFDEKRKNNVYPNKKEKKTTPAEGNSLSLTIASQ